MPKRWKLQRSCPGTSRAFGLGMTYRIDIDRRCEAERVLLFQGLLDRAALDDLLLRIVASALPVRLVLRTGTELDPVCLAAVRALPAHVFAESAFLSRWLSEELP